MAFVNPTVQDFKDFFVRDFPYNSDPDLGVTDSDIANAYRLTNAMINPDFFGTDDIYALYYLYLAAHYLVTSLNSSSSGVSGSWSGLVASKSVGSVSTSYSIPQKYLDNPQFGWLASTRYGAMYLSFLVGQLSGAIFTVCGSTRP